MATMNFGQVIIIEIDPGASVALNVPSGTVWKIESAAIGGTNGTLNLKRGDNRVGILFSTVSGNLYGTQHPFWLNDSYDSFVENDSPFYAALSISEWQIM